MDSTGLTLELTDVSQEVVSQFELDVSSNQVKYQRIVDGQNLCVSINSNFSGKMLFVQTSAKATYSKKKQTLKIHVDIVNTAI